MCHRIAEYEVLTERLVHFARPEVTSSNARSGSASWRGRCHLPICYFYARPGTVCTEDMRHGKEGTGHSARS